MNEDLLGRLARLEGKQAIHRLTLIANGAPAEGASADVFMAGMLQTMRNQAATAGIELASDFEAAAPEAMLEGRDAGALARTLLTELAQTPGGAALVRAALDQPDTTAADFGIVSGSVLLIVAWLAITGEIDIKIGGIAYRKQGLSPLNQVEIAKKLLPEMVKVLR
jgi:hypothetical protein